MGYKQENSKGNEYFLNTKSVKFGAANRNIYYFSKDERPEHCDLPEGMEVIEGKTGMLMVKKIK